MTRDLVVGIDCSTTAAKAVVWGPEGEAVAQARAAFGHASPHPGWGEQNPEDWWTATAAAVRAACAGVDASRLAALAVTHQRETFVCLDADDRPVRPAILWLDTRATAEVAAHGTEAVHEATGKPANTATSWFKLLWLRAHEPQVMAQTARVADVHAFLVHRMTGAWRTSLGSLDPLGLTDLRTGRLDDGLLAMAGLDARQIPEAHPPGAVLGEVQGPAAEAMGLPPGLAVVAGLGDGQAAGLGAGIAAPGQAYLNLGTGIVSGTLAREYRWGRAFRTMQGAIPGTYVLETFIGGGTYNVTWFADRLSGVPERPFGLDLSREQVLEAAAANVPPGSEGLLALPYLAGALAPYWDSEARGAFVGLTGRHGRAHLYRALLEGLAMEQRLATTGAEAALGARVEGFQVMGGGSRSALWCQVLADVLRRPVEVAAEAEATCLGAGMLAAAGAGVHGDVTAAVRAMSRPGRAFAPRPRQEAAYDRLFAIYEGIYPALREPFARLGAFVAEPA